MNYSEKRMVYNMMTNLIVCLIQREYTPESHGDDMESSIRELRDSIEARVIRSPGLQASLGDIGWAKDRWSGDHDWLEDAWNDAVKWAPKKIGVAHIELPTDCPWTANEVMGHGFVRNISQGDALRP